MSGSYYNSIGLTASGIAYGWGRNSSGQLGDGTTTNRSSPVIVVGGITNWVQLSAGGGHSLGLTATGIVYAWGANNYGRLGDGTTTSRSSPVTVVGGITNWSQVSAGGDHNLGLFTEL
jgi:alpha-tubulin suppressor-like RCC1 family protein